jgi:hypothetical protein
MEKKLDKLNISLTNEEVEILSEICSKNNLSKSDLIRKLIVIASSKRHELKQYIKDRNARISISKKKEIKFNTAEFFMRLIDEKEKRLLVDIAIIMDDIRVYLDKGTSACIKNHKNGAILLVEIYKPKVKYSFTMSLKVLSVKDVKICSSDTNIEIDYYPISVPQLADFKYLKIYC